MVNYSIVCKKMTKKDFCGIIKQTEITNIVEVIMYEKIDKNLYTPMMRQYLEIKENYPDTLVFFRLGDFYEMFFNDAIVASRELEIVLTGRDAGVNNERVPMCGVPHHAVDSYIEKLTNRGYKVAIVEQLEEPGGKKIVHRDVTKIVTPGTNIDEVYLNEKNNNYIGAIEKIDNGYAFSYIDLSTGEAKITNFPSNIDLVYSEISKLNIKEIVVNKTFDRIISDHLSKVYGILVSICDEIDVEKYLISLVENLKASLQICAKRLLSYIIKTQKRVLVHLQEFYYYDSKDYLRLDNSAIKNLELVESLKGNRFKNNLFCILDKCSTAMGSRFLKRSILFPLVDLRKITERQDLIEEFTKNGIIVEDIKKNLMEIYDLERIVGRISYGNLNPKDLIQLKKSIGVLPNMKELLAKIKGKVASKKAEEIVTYDALFQLLDRAIDENAGFALKDGGVIKDGYSEELDHIKHISSTNKDFLINLEKREREKTGIKNLRVGYNKVFGYYIEVTKSYLGLVKDEFGYIRKQTTSNSERYITEELKEREALILRSDERSIELEIELFNKIREECKGYATSLQTTAKLISEIDMLLSLAIVAKTMNYVRPSFSLYDEYEIVEGRHPVIETTMDKPFIPNDLTLYNNDKILLITGPNMSGKSTYMRQNAIIAIMAQMGSFVPAKSAKLPMFDQIFTRIGSSDDIASGESTFMTEMLEVNYAIQNATERSLIILDEVGRGTATFDGMALAQAIIEHLHFVTRAKTLFSTHYHELTILEKSLPALKNVHVEANASNFETTGELVFLHKVLDGPSDQSYGINVASLAKIPVEVTLRAKDILSKLEQKSNFDENILSIQNYTKPIVQVIEKNTDQANAILNLIKESEPDNMKPIDALIFLNKLKDMVNEDE